MQIKDMTEDDFKTLKDQAVQEYQNSIRPNKRGLWLKKDFTNPYYGDLSLGNGTQYKVGIFMYKGRLFVGVERKGAYTFGGWCHWTYAQEKLNLMVADAKNFADFINTQLGDTDKPQGIYEPYFCEGEFDLEA